MRRLFVILTCSLCVPQLRAQDENRKKIDAFFAGPIRTLRFTIGNEGVERLRRAPREYVEAKMTDGGQVYGHVAFKLKGSQGSFQGLERKPGITLNFDHLDEGGRYHGMKRFHLNNAAQDPTFMNELIAGEIARKAGVPAPRCTHAIVKLNGRDLGLYVLRESYTREFLAEFYPDAGGDLYDGKNTEFSEKTALQLGKPKKADTAAVKALIAACGEADDAERWKKLVALMDMDRFVNYLALENILVHWDSYSSNRNNYLVYQDPKTRKFSFVLDGMDQTLAFPGHELVQKRFVGTVTDAVMRTPEGKRMYLARVAAVLKTVLKPIDWPARVDAVGAKVREAVGTSNPDQAKALADGIKLAKERVTGRIQGVERQVAAFATPAKK